MTRVIISITCMTASHLRAEQEIKQRLLRVSRLRALVAKAPSFCLTLQEKSHFKNGVKASQHVVVSLACKLLTRKNILTDHITNVHM